MQTCGIFLSAKEKMVEPASFKLHGDFNPGKISTLKNTIQKNTRGVRACAINIKSHHHCSFELKVASFVQRGGDFLQSFIYTNSKLGMN
jgi:hypothetical protein